MQTFVPVADFTESARLLDNPRLGKQRVECLQVLRALELPDYGWANHPVVTMWRGHTAGLVVYSLAMVRVWRERGFADTTEALISEFAPDAAAMTQAEAQAAGLLPSWVGDEELHLSHRSNLLAKDPEFYRPRFPGDPDDLPYVWPGADEVPPAPAPEGVRVWVVRPRAHNELGACLAAGVIGLGTQSGIDVDATGLGPAELRDLSKEISGRRPAKDLRQLSTFLDELRPGDPVGLPIEHGAGLLLGEVVGDYLFQGRELLPHRRAARWDRVVPRSAARPPATLQDPRALFSVVLDPAALA
ncbi:MSMEG_6728 family protein [Blastococcus sp. TML/M2B]|nr:MSMEG_6728 family protein [Blastococcus sp. TML/C7B]MBN1091521.1 MSMEG_6728 family protein [Blastococcus sp. TML/M2B]MBN1094928.1 MSMEG_6728 family protein [Blastococcus sp. TML/C7B]